jgi:hypothetical protein
MLALLFTLSPVPRARAGEGEPAPTKTQVSDAKAREQLLGEHPLTLQWISDGGKVGKVETRVDYIADGKVCPREGRFTFRITGKRRYWRMKEMNNPCEDVVDYVDVYLR